MLYNEASLLLNHKNIWYILAIPRLQIEGILTAPLPEESSLDLYVPRCLLYSSKTTVGG